MKHKMKKRYAEGDLVGMDVEVDTKALKDISDKAIGENVSSFKDAFAAARRKMLKEGGPKEFTWRGTKYTTELDTEKAAREQKAKSAAKPAKVSEVDKALASAPTERMKPLFARKTQKYKLPETKDLFSKAPAKATTPAKAPVKATPAKAPVKATPASAPAKRTKPFFGSNTPKYKLPGIKELFSKTTSDKDTVKKAKGGSASKRADGCAIRGKTRAR